MNFSQSLERLPRRRFAHRDVGIVGLHRLAMRGIGHAHGQPRPDQRIQDRQLHLVERKRAVITRHDRCGHGQWILLAKNGVSRGNRRLRHDQSMMHVAKVDHARHFAWQRPRLAHQHVVIVGIPVDHAAPQSRQNQSNFGFVKRQESFHQRPLLCIRNMLKNALYPRGPRRIPLQFPVRCRMRKRLQSGIHLAQKPPEVAEEPRRVRTHFCENSSLHESQQPHEACGTLRPRDGCKKFALEVAYDAWQG